ncbi:proline-rich protein 4-like isoform X5 [Salvia splendens]|uniref:proline-rich protein 4-like isoform X5 n=1 Tax=Salvia splendens TaxID=180675 RepID=UPI001C252CD7|nr:proline-rich protein 4-like isoform X5 [Salvia splendens]
MRLHSLSLSLVFLLLCLLTFCNAAFEIAGSAQCADCELNNFKTAHAFSGLHVTIDCKVEKEIKRVGKGELDADGKFKISLPKEIIVDVKNKHCFAQLHSAATPCPGVGATQIVFKSQIDGKVTFTPKEALTFSTALCTSKFLWPFFEYPPLPKTYSWKKHWPQITIPPLKKHHWKKVWPKITIPHPIVKTLPPPVPIYKPKPKIPVVKPLPPSVPVYKPKPKLPVVKPHPPSVPIYKPKPKIPVVKPLPPSVPVYKPKPKLPVVKPHPPSVPIYKPKPKIPVVKPLPPSVPIYNPKPPVKHLPPHVPIYKPPTKPIPHPFHKPPVVKPSVPIYKPLPPLFPLPPFYKKPCPPFSKFPPKSYGHPKFGYFPKFPPFKPIP